MRSFLSAAALVALFNALVKAAPTAYHGFDNEALAARSEATHILAHRSLKTDPAAFAAKSYDYIVVGAGTAGLAVAARLSESGKYTVGVLEAGPAGFGDPIIDIPGQFGADLGTKYDYNYTTAANKETGVPSLTWPRGHVVGGSSALNFLVWDAAAEKEYDAWQELGAAGWNWSTMDKYMRKAESFTAPSAKQQQELNIQVVPSDYGTKGAVSVSFPRYISKQVQNWIPALKSLGIPVNDQPLAGDNLGASVQPSDINTYNSTRDYSAPAYFYPNSARPNLSLLPNAQVDKIVFSGATTSCRSGLKHASGVKFTYTETGKSFTVKANKEVIVSGGTVNSPQILELSGIGNATVLKKAGIQQIIDNPNVGENLQDHTYSFVTYELDGGVVNTLDSLRWNTSFTAEQKKLYAANQTSILDETVPAIAYITLERLMGSENATKAIAAAKAYVNTINAPYKATLQKQLEFLEDSCQPVSQMELIGVDGFFAGAGAPETGKNYVTFLSASQHLFARGSVHINASTDPAVAPVIQPNYYNNKFDLDVAVAGVEYLRKIGSTKEYNSYITEEVIPGKSADIKNFLIKEGTVTEYHPVGTCSNLPREKGGVVDPTLRIYGTSNVRVVDASVIPLEISAHIMRTVYGVAEYASDMILYGI